MSITDNIIDRLERRLARYEKKVKAKAQADEAAKYWQLRLWNESDDGVDPQ